MTEVFKVYESHENYGYLVISFFILALISHIERHRENIWSLHKFDSKDD